MCEAIARFTMGLFDGRVFYDCPYYYLVADIADLSPRPGSYGKPQCDLNKRSSDCIRGRPRTLTSEKQQN